MEDQICLNSRCLRSRREDDLKIDLAANIVKVLVCEMGPAGKSLSVCSTSTSSCSSSESISMMSVALGFLGLTLGFRGWRSPLEVP